MRKIAVDCRNDRDILGDTCDGSKEINCTFKGSGEETCASKEEIAYTCGLEVEDARRPGPFYDF